MMETRERKIMDGLLILCITAGFACFALIVLPQQISKAGSAPMLSARHTSISSIIELSRPADKTGAPIKAEGIIARFVPDAEPLDPFATGTAGVPTPPSDDEFAAAGGAGAAVDDGDQETAVAYDQARASEAMRQETVEPDLAVGDPYGDSPSRERPSYDDSGTRPAGTGRSSLVVHPQSSIALGAPSALDSGTGKRSMAWLIPPQGFEEDVAFWRDIYSRYDKDAVVLHHPRYLDIVYDVVDLRDISSNPRLNEIERERMREQRVDERKAAITGALEKIAQNPEPTGLSGEERRIYDLLTHVEESDKYRRAAREYGVRAQVGQADKFIAGLKYCNRYLGEIEKIFAAYGLPKELTRLIFVESMFNPMAMSSAGASGFWQFMRGTGKLYLRINDLYDERNDPIAATHAAAKLLLHNYEELGSWPLAINAYNAGRGRLSQAVAQLGTRDIGKIMRNFSHPSYGFASRNFFLEFLAAYDVAEHYNRFFGNINFDEPLRYEEVTFDYHVSVPEIARLARTPLDEIAELNPHLTNRVVEGVRLLPAGTRIRVPENKGEIMIALSSRSPNSRKGPVHHVVQEGETMSSIAAIYGITPVEIMKQNRIGRSVHRGQTLKIPVR